ncbi:MAG: hypothetical protein U0270_03865 [Labilithrix sp.]
MEARADEANVRTRIARRLEWPVLGATVFALASLAWFVREHAYSLYDDAFIYLRFVHHVKAGCGLRWNCNDAPVEGFSGPLYLALLVAGSRVTSKLVTLTQVLGSIGVAGALALAISGAAQPFERTRRPERAMAAIAVALLLGLDHFVLLNAVIGLETALAACAATAVLVAVTADARRLTIAMAFVLALLRPEGVIFVLLLPMLRWARTPRVLGACLGGLVAIALARWSIFHDVVPNTYWAKSGGSARHFELGAAYLVDAARDFPAIFLAPLALAWRSRRESAAYFLAASGLWSLSVVRAGGDTFSYSRLLFPLVPALTVLAVRGAMAFGRAPAEQARVVRVATAAAAALGVRAAVAHAIPEAHGFENVMLWTAVGKHLKAHYPGKTVATVPVGAIGYFSQLEVLDLVGLNSREIARAGRTVPPELLTRTWIGHERHDLEYTLSRAPDLVVTTRVRATPWQTLEEASAGFWADRLLLGAARTGGAPYRVEDLPIANGVHVLALARTE